jgi:phytoene dehydrogenase-like protein
VQLASGEELSAGVVVSSADPVRTFEGMVDPIDLDPDFTRDVGNVRFRGVSARVHLALGELPAFGGPARAGTREEMLSGTITIAPSMDDLERAYDDAKHGGVSARPLLEAVIPTVHDASLAPAGRHVMSVRVQFAPYHLRDGGWTDERREALGDLVVDALAEHAPNLPGAIIERRVFTPADLETRFALTEGSVTHGEMTLDQILFMRPVAGHSRHRSPIDGLYMCGSGTHPGGGHAGASAYLAAREIMRDARRGARRGGA